MSNAATPLVSAAALQAELAQESASCPAVLDVRYPGPGSPIDGQAQYLAGHIPGAAYLSMDDVLAAPHIPGVTGRHPLPAQAVLQAGLRAAGVSAGRPVVVYDDWKSIAAARAWWLLRWAGHRDVRVLDGGWQAWLASGGPQETGETRPQPGEFTVHGGSCKVVDAVGAAHLAQEGVLLDARPANRFRGEDETIDPVAGHIPGAKSLPALSLVDEGGCFLPAVELQRRFDAVGARRGVAVGLYCGSGIQACHAALAAAACGGVDDVAVYAGSWSEWITDPSRPVAVGLN
ncbi:3-mercaptopyruvate sulfurtransferase [Actinomyces bovis]|uniref:Sulfurtransferase n=1 Tax=Actinomyces bovis TaxID=1658 RepID=A0ABY1VN67_9ACTO|nr:sulfurtransferase [Actinomyces bovis]SPT53197.1 3-mercaptopyruvate sulfurtransferase [Actinomyces bovis]VEG52416.1 3-mercaptopyruvate sulfurtransferase [Actinomyces israelii]